MEMFSPEFFSALFSILVIDLVLAGDNAVVIAMAANRLPENLRKKAVLYGTAGAVIIRVVMTLMAVYLLSIPFLQAVGGVILIPIAIKLLKPSGDKHIEAADSLGEAIKTIIIADAAMGIDNVLGVAGAAGGSFMLVCIGLVISIPIVVGCSQLIGRLMDKWPVLIYLGAAILGRTAGEMVIADKAVGPYLAELMGTTVPEIIPWAIAIAVCAIGYMMQKNKA